uniref:Deoxyhypusine hydroxylase n=1 Tax=Plectus sambesii TaxID=2011161 RepID=A0A914UZJ4_9BILA
MSAHKEGFPPERIAKIGAVLNDSAQPLKARFRALFILRNVGGEESIEEIGRCFSDPSALLKHELAYCLGQMQDSRALPVLRRTLEDTAQEPMVRHEAGEALGAIGDMSSLDILDKYATDPLPEVSETCQLAAKKIRWAMTSKEKLSSNPYYSVDPTPPVNNAQEKETGIEKLGQILTDTSLPLWERYRAMFSLRNIGTDAAIKALGQGLFCEDSALFRHEVAFVLGQVQSAVVIDELKARLILKTENPMVRHECAEALGAIATEECETILKEYLKDEERVVRESCEVALDMVDYENSPDFQYATID